jgi:hypothetical protein
MHGKMMMMPTVALTKRPTSRALIGRWPLVLLALLLNAAPARASDDMLVYSDRFHNGWGDNWSWMPRYATNNPVYSGSNSMALVPSGHWQAWWLKSGTSVDTTIYTNVSFWLNGGATGGQSILVSGETNGTGLPGVWVTAPTNSWKQFTISLTALAINNKTNLSGFQIGNGTSTQPFFIDALSLVAAPAPATVQVSVLANQTVRKVDGKVFGINQVAWDGSVNTPSTAAVLNDIGATCLRWPGGSWADGYHWTNEAWNEGSTGPRFWGSFSPDFIALATNTHSDAFIIVNYGTSTPEEAAYGVRMFNITNQCNFKYWEVGNEIGGSWEWDWPYPGFATNDILNLSSLANKLKTPTNNISTYLRSQLSSYALSTLDSYIANPSANNAAALRWALVNDLNNLMYNSSHSIYKTDTNRFAGVTFRSLTWTNLSLPITPIGQDLPNRMTLEDAYPELAQLTPAVNLASNWPNVYLPHDPWTYAMRFTNYYAQMKAADPTIKVGALADVFETGTVNYTHRSVVNPRTGQTHYGWNPVMLTYLRSNNCIPDFLIVHDYGPTAGDTQDLLYPRVWASHAASVRQQLTDYLGDAATNVTLEVTESGMGGDKQYASLPGGLFYADSIGQILQTEFNSRVWWDTRNGVNSLDDSDPAYYGWRTDGSGKFISDAGIIYGQGGVGSAYPTYYCAKLMPHFAKDGDTVVRATSDYPLLAVYSVKRTNGNLTLLVINKSRSSNLTAAINLSGYLPYTNAAVYSYGIPQDDAARTGVGSPDIAQTNLTGVQSSFSATFGPFSATVMVLSAGNQPPFTPAGLTATVSNAAVVLTWDLATGADSYIINRSTTSGGAYTTIASGVTATSYLDAGLVNGTTYYYVVAATNVYGVSSNSVEVSATPTDMRAHYAFEGNAIDTSGNGFNGTANALSYVAGKVGAQAGQFNGSSSYVAIPRSITDDFSVALWVKTTDTAGSAGAQWWSGKGLVDGEVGGGGADWGTAIVNGKFVLGVGSSSGDTTIASSVNINEGTWHHVAATRNNTSGAMQVYVDGVLRGSGTGPTGPRTWPPNLRIGSLQTANNFLNGTLDDVRLYNRILTPTEVAALIGTPPAIAFQPASQAVVAGNPATFSVTATGTAPLAYQWKFNGTNLANASSSSYTISNAQPTNSGSYSVLVTNLAGSATSSNAMLTVTAASPASNPTPANGATGIALSPNLGWTAGANADSHRVFFGVNSNTVAVASTNTPEFKGLQLDTSYSPGSLAASGRFYWRVDEMAGGLATPGPVWTFATAIAASGVTTAGEILSGGGFELSFPSSLGQTYRIESTDTLSPPSWTTISNNIPGSGNQFHILETNLSAQRFYRVVIISP